MNTVTILLLPDPRRPRPGLTNMVAATAPKYFFIRRLGHTPDPWTTPDWTTSASF
jgi:hypothetical protein